MPRQLYTGHLPALEAQLHQSISTLKQGDPLSEVWVLVPNQLSRLYLRRALARKAGIVANLHFLTLHDLARKLAEPLLLEEEWIILGELALDPLFAQCVLEFAPNLSYLSPIVHTAGFRRALLSTWQELRLHQVEESDLREITYPDRERAQKAADLGALLSFLSHRFHEKKWLDSVGVMELAARAVGKSELRIPPMAIYALHEIPPLGRRVLSACSRAAELHAFLPWRENAEGYHWTAALRNWYVREGFSEEVCDLPESWPEGLRMISDTLFDGEPAFIEDNTLALISAPRASSEATEVARELLYCRMAPGERAAIVIPHSGDEILGPLRNRLASAGFSPYFHACRTLGESAAGRGIKALCSLLTGNCTRANLVELLLAVPFVEEHAAYSAEWVRIVHDLASADESARWIAQLDKLIAALTRRVKRAEENIDDDGPAAQFRLRVTLAETLREFLKSLFHVIEEIRAQVFWAQAAEKLWDYYESIAAIDEDFEGLALQLAQAGALDQARVPYSINGLAQLFHVALRTPASREGKFQRNEPTVATREQLYGVISDDLFVMGLSEGIFPRRDQPDPLLLDDDRRELNHRLEQHERDPLPLSSQWPERERFWLQSLITSARNSLTVSHSRSDKQERGLIASSFMRECASKLYGSDLTTEDVFQRLRDRDGGRYVFAHQLGTEDPAESISPAEYDASSLDQKSRFPLLHREQDEPFRRAFLCESARFTGKHFTRFDGVTEDEVALKLLGEHHTSSRLYSATELEHYWQCPFRYFAAVELEAFSPDTEAELDPFGPLERGTLIHSILEKYHRARLNKPISADNYALSDLFALAQTEMRLYAEENPTGPRFLWARHMRMIERTLGKYYGELLNLGPTWKTIGVETGFGKRGDALPVARIADGETAISFKGRIDRCDEDTNGALLLTDYKAGKKKSGRAKERRLQLCIYSAALAGKSDTVRAQYLFLTAENCIEDPLPSPPVPSSVEIVSLVRDLRKGIFVPDPSPDDSAVCRNCVAKSACGAVRHTKKWRRGGEVPAMQTSRGSS
ncbi:PD-(D/E)XK nuclease family protein [bacterium]|nr:PD-(D/E)XK nuclease family protein [bacterium]